MPEPVKGSGRYMAGLDGLRALAVFAVMIYHLKVEWAPGGLLGVGMFFVLSGYLITDILVAQWKRNGRLDLKDFWLRRARRLLPAMLVMLVAVAGWLAFYAPSRLIMLQRDGLAALFYVSNWWYIFRQVSYFESFGPPSPFGHLWSLAVEEQFYLLWPLALSLGLRCTPRRWQLVMLTLLIAAVSALAMALLYQPGVDPSRVYYGTDTRVFALLIGAALAMIWPSRNLSANIPSLGRISLDLLGGASLLTVLLMIWLTSQYDLFLYQGGLVLFSIFTALAVAALAHPASRLARGLGWGPLRWLGVRSYGIYLWHYPVILLTSPTVDTGGVHLWRVILQVAGSVLLADLSWRFVEKPIRHGAWGKVWAKMRERSWRKYRLPLSRLVASAYALLVLAFSWAGMADRVSDAKGSSAAPNTGFGSTESGSFLNPADLSVSSSSGIGAEQSANSALGKRKKESDRSVPGKSTTQSASSAPHIIGLQSDGSTADKGAWQPVPAGISFEKGRGITALGDSVMLDAEPYLKKLLPGIVIDAKVGRQMSQAQAVAVQLKATGALGDQVIIELGTNGSFAKEQLLTLLQSLGEVQQIILVNTRVPRPWEGVVNETLAEVAATFPNTTLVDWYANSAGKDSYFSPDGVHLSAAGSQYYATLVAKAVKVQSRQVSASGKALVNTVSGH